MMVSAAAPAPGDDAPLMLAGERNFTLDFVRGVAVMGILVMNIVAFAMPDAAYSNPRAYGGWSGGDLAVYLFNFVLFDGKMRGLFSFLFGASTLLVIERAQARSENAARVHYARMFWLLAFGLAHLFLLWWGDILHHYALIGMLLFLFRDWPVKRLVRMGIVLIALETALTAGLPFAIARNAAEVARPHPTASAIATQRDFESTFGAPPRAEITETLSVYRSGYPVIVADRLDNQASTPAQTVLFLGMETLAYMLFGMAALRSGMLRGVWPAARYWRWVAIGFGIGVPVYALLGAYLVSAKFSAFAVTVAVIAATTPIRPVMIMGWAALLALAARSRVGLSLRVAAAGRMAFTNYLVTSLVMTTIFYGYGLGLYGTLSRAALYPFVLAMCAAMLVWSMLWLKRFRYGPFEWLWRSLARGEVQSMRRPAAA